MLHRILMRPLLNSGTMGGHLNAVPPRGCNDRRFSVASICRRANRFYCRRVSDVPGDTLPTDVQALEDDARKYPQSEWRQSRFLTSFCRGELYRHPRRGELILDYLSRFPRSSAAKSAAVHPDPVAAPDTFKAVEAFWLELRKGQPNDVDFAIGHAALVANDDPSRSTEILRDAITLLPKNASLWTELGRVAPEPLQSLEALKTARALGSDQPNLIVWIGRAAVGAGRPDDVYEVGCELMSRANQTRETVRSPVGWEGVGRGAWTQIRAALENSPDRPELIHALSEYANDTHWAHTFLGLVAAEQGQLSEAGKHLERSAAIWAEPRMSSYGPSFLLANKLCELRMWKDVERFLVACKNLWNDQILEDWIQEIKNERTPAFEEP